jgi:hypothetical protein
MKAQQIAKQCGFVGFEVLHSGGFEEYHLLGYDTV